MLFSHSVIRRYTPPTCTLEIVGKSSPLSRWAQHPLLKQLNFKLHFDDPRSPEKSKVTIGGDRAQLEWLCEAVRSYVQVFLSSSIITSNNSSENTSVEKTQVGIEPFRDLFSLKPRLQQKSLTKHQLFLGSLANEESGSELNLSVLQLHDLATALENYSAEIEALPELNGRAWIQTPPVWAGTAAAVLLVVGLSTVVVRVFNQPSPESESIASINKQEPTGSTQPSPIAVIPPAPPPNSTPIPSPTLPTPLSSARDLPPPPAVNVLPPPTQPPQPIGSPTPTPAPNSPNQQTVITLQPQEATAGGTEAQAPPIQVGGKAQSLGLAIAPR